MKLVELHQPRRDPELQTNMKYTVIALALLAACSHGNDSGTYTPPIDVLATGALDASMDPTAWEVGPSAWPGGNPSSGIPLHPLLHPQGWMLNIPTAPGSAQYITRPTGPLAGKQKIIMQFRVELDGDAKLVPSDGPPGLTGSLALYFEKRGLCWSAKCESDRWFAPQEGRVRPLNAGTYFVEVPFVANWSAVLTSTRENNISAYNAALANAGRVGFVLGGGDGLGHGVHCTSPNACRIVVLRYEVQ